MEHRIVLNDRELMVVRMAIMSTEFKKVADMFTAVQVVQKIDGQVKEDLKHEVRGSN